MKKFLFFTFCFLSMTVFSEINLISNGDFEKGIEKWKCVKIVKEGEKTKAITFTDKLSLSKDTPDGSKNSLKVSYKIEEGYTGSPWNSGVFGILKEKIPVNKNKLIKVDFYAKRISGAKYLNIGRLWGGSERKIIKLQDKWKKYEITFSFTHPVNEILFSPVNSFMKVSNGEFLLDNVTVKVIDKKDIEKRAGKPKGPSILICSPQGAGHGWIDLNYLKELYDKGFEIDYTNNLKGLTWDRIKNYNVLLLYESPGYAWFQSKKGKYSKEFAKLIDKYLSEGGGIFLMPTETNLGRQKLIELTDLLGAKIPAEAIVEEDKNKIAPVSHMSYYVPLAYTENIFPSPVSKDIKQIWYPYKRAYLSQMTAPLIIDNNWKIVVRASKTSHTEPIDISNSTEVIKNPIIRKEGEKQPPIFAIREYKKGRVALCAMWRQFTIGAGTKWLYNREVLSRGLKGKTSDFGKLLENTFRYLAEPSMKKGFPGGYVTPENKLVPPNHTPEAKSQFNYHFWKYEPEVLGYRHPPKNGKLFRGIIGAKSIYGGGKSTVEEYVKAGKKAGLDFIIFMDDFDKLTKEKFEKLKDECKKYSDTGIKLIPGFSIKNNIGNYMFFYGEDAIWIPDKCLTGKNKEILYIQQEDGKGNYTGYLTPFLDWVLSNYHRENSNVGYYNFKGSGKGMKMPDLRLYAAVGIRYYKDGKLIEDVTNDYLTTAQCTIAPNPVSINEVVSADRLINEVKKGHSLTYVFAKSLSTILKDGLRWTHQYDGVNVFLSNGPEILSWPYCHRVITYGGEAFVTPISVMPSNIYITSDVGLKEIKIYNGKNLCRRFLLNGRKEFSQTLVLDGTVQKNLVLIAEDIKGGKAVSFPRRCWKDGAFGITFCSDHVNAYIDGLLPLAHGPYWYPVNRPPNLPVDIAGYTWDGGPPASLPLYQHNDTVPVITTENESEDGRRFYQIPLLEFTDEGALAVTSEKNTLYDKKLLRIVNPWHTYGPVDGKPEIFQYVQRYREYLRPTVGVPEVGWAGPGVRDGINASSFVEELKFLKDAKIKSIRLGYFASIKKEAIFVISNKEGIKEYPVSKNFSGKTFYLKKGDWFGFYKKGISSSHLFINRSIPLKLTTGGNVVYIYADGIDKIKKGERVIFEMAGFGFPVNVEINKKEDFEKVLNYVKNPSGMKIIRGKRIDNPGIVEILPENYGVEISIPKPEKKLNLTLPVMIKNLNPGWTAILWLKKGYVKGDYGEGKDRARELGIDVYGNAYVPVYVDYSDITSFVAGHPVIAEGKMAEKLFIQVTHVQDNPDKWHISVNNPTDKTISAVIKKVINLPGMKFKEKKILIKPGGYVIVE